MADYTTITYRDEVLSDQELLRCYSDGTYEWRRPVAHGRIDWRDSHGASGTDELLGKGIIKRITHGGSTAYGREQGYGRTAWQNDATRILMVSETSLGGRIGATLQSIGIAKLMGSIIWPPANLRPDDEEALRNAQRRSGLFNDNAQTPDRLAGSQSIGDSERKRRQRSDGAGDWFGSQEYDRNTNRRWDTNDDRDNSDFG